MSNSNKKHLATKLRRLAFLLNVSLSIITISTFFTPYFSPADHPLNSILGLTYSIQIIAHFLFIIFWIIVKKIYAVISSAFIVIELLVINAVASFNPLSENFEPGMEILIGNYNMQISIQVGEDKSEKEAFSMFLQDNDDIDIFTLQECGRSSLRYIKSSMSFEYEFIPTGSRVVLLSKFPIIQSGILDEGFTGANNCIWADLIINRDTIRTYSVHLESNRFDGIQPVVINETATEDISRDVLIGLVRNYPQFSQVRTHQAKMISDHVAQSPYPTIISGDFNDVPFSQVYTLMADQLNDTFKEKGHGIGTTLDSAVPGLRIDYILTSPDIQTLDHHVKRTPFSDHFLQRVAVRPL